MADAVGEPGCLPLLQFALTRLWEDLRFPATGRVR
ncbi:hypothetical protein [Streptomyces rochei]